MSRFNCMYLIRCGYPDSHKYQEIDFSDYGWQTGDLKMAELLISTGNVFSDALEKLKRTPLIHAAINGRLAVLKPLAQADQDILRAINSCQFAPMVVAYLKGHIGIVEFLLDRQCSADVDVNADDNDATCLWLLSRIRVSSRLLLYLPKPFTRD